MSSEIELAVISPHEEFECNRASSSSTKPYNIYIPGQSTIFNASLNQVLFFYFKRIELSKRCKCYIQNNLRDHTHIMIKWKFSGMGHSIKSPKSVDKSKLKFNILVEHKLNFDEELLGAFSEIPIQFQLFAVNDMQEVLISTAQLYLGTVLEAMTKKEQRVIFTNKTIEPTNLCVAYLELWYQFSCSKKEFQRSISDRAIEKITVQAKDADGNQLGQNLLSSLFPEPKVDITQSEISHELEEKIHFLECQSNEEQKSHGDVHTLEKCCESASLKSSVIGVDKELRILKQKFASHKPEFVITVAKLYFLEGSFVLNDKSIERVYVEYNLFNENDLQNEAPFSVTKGSANCPSIFDWSRSFDIDAEKNYSNAKTLANFIRKKEPIKFMVISEPRENFEKQIQTCKEVGYAEVQLDKLIEFDDNVDFGQYEIVDCKNSMAVVGYMTVKFEGVQALKATFLALTIPEDQES